MNVNIIIGTSFLKFEGVKLFFEKMFKINSAGFKLFNGALVNSSSIACLKRSIYQSTYYNIHIFIDKIYRNIVFKTQHQGFERPA